MIEVAGVSVPLDAALPGNERMLANAAARALGLRPDAVRSARFTRRSVDARQRRQGGRGRSTRRDGSAARASVRFAATLAVELSPDAREADVLAGTDALAPGVRVRPFAPYEPLAIPALGARIDGLGENARPIVVGTGPAGLFCALYLAAAGLRPLVLERGGNVDERQRAVAAFDAGGPLDLSDNVQFGEGGAGTFSDGKLTTGTKSPLQAHVLHEFVRFGAPADILVDAHPHIGTDLLAGIVRAMRCRVEQLGGEVRFHARLADIDLDECGRVRAVRVEHEGSGAFERIACRRLVVACGHSARDTFALMDDAGLALEAKPFAVGVRIEHAQSSIDRARYGASAGHQALGPADYRLVVHPENTRSVYTFCMCPGGTVVCAASEERGLVVNGMSTHARDGKNANSALLVGVTPEDFGGSGPLAGIAFQRKIEQAAFELACGSSGVAYQAPAQTVGDFLARSQGKHSATVKPSYARGVVWCDLHACLPSFVSQALEAALPALDAKLSGFAAPGAVLTGVETRSSSPVRVLRDPDDMQARLRRRAPAPTGIYPCGEGSGYAGGIMSSAVDGLKAAVRLAADLADACSADVGCDLPADERAAGSDGAPCPPVPSGGKNGDRSVRACGVRDLVLCTLAETAASLRAGKPAVFPTDTVWGVGVAVDCVDDPGVLYVLKNRDRAKPIAWLVGSISDLERYGSAVPAWAINAARAHWPGGLTLIVRASGRVPPAYRSKAGTIGLRMPASDACLALINEVGCPLATTSANPAGAPAPGALAELDSAFARRVGTVMDASAEALAREASGIASTVIDCTASEPRVVRQGTVVL